MKPQASFDALLRAVQAACRDGSGMVVVRIEPLAGPRIMAALLRGRDQPEGSPAELARRLRELDQGRDQEGQCGE